MARFIPNGYEPASGAAERRANYDLMRRISTLVDEVDALQTLTTVTPWTGVTFENSWVDYGTPGWRGVQYRKVGDEVQIRGLAARASDSTATMFTLPTGFRPLQPELFPAYSNSGLVRIDVQVSGIVAVVFGAAGYSLYVSLSPIRFSVKS